MNPRHPAPKAGALPTALIPGTVKRDFLICYYAKEILVIYVQSRSCNLPEPDITHYTMTASKPAFEKISMVQVTGIEPASSAWKAEVLPLNYTCMSPLKGGCIIKDYNLAHWNHPQTSFYFQYVRNPSKNCFSDNRETVYYSVK